MAANPLSPDSIGTQRYCIFTNTETGITATPSGGQSGAYALRAQINVVPNVANANDSVALPKIGPQGLADGNPAMVGFPIIIHNTHASNSLQVFGASPDTINGVATGTGVAVAAGSKMLAWAESYNVTTGVGTWGAMIVS